MMAIRNYRSMVPWHELESFIRDKLTSHYINLGKAKGEEIYQLQGRVQELQELLGVPEVLAARAEEKEEEGKSAS